MAQLYAQVIVPRPLDASFTYRVPEELVSKAGIGYRAIVPFGNRRFVTGIIESLSPVKPNNVANIKDIDSILDDSPVIVHPQLKLWHWISDYYMCTAGDVMKAAMPGGLKVESETIVELADDLDPDLFTALTRTQLDIVGQLRKIPKLSIRDLSKRTGIANVEQHVSRLVDRGIVAVHEKLVNRYRRIKMKMVEITLARGDSGALDKAFAAVRRSKGQQTALLNLIALSGFNIATQQIKAVSRDELLDASPDITWANVQALQEKGLARIYSREISRFSAPEGCTGLYSFPLPTLSDAQQQALSEIHGSMLEKNVTLLHGVTSSGKTEIYIHLIDYVLRQRRQVLMLVPEIALTTQLTRRLQRVFGSRVRIYHSKFSDNERVDIWRDMLSDHEPCVVIGARSAVFLPFSSLGLVIVDEEHDPSYKQTEPAPRYNGRDTAIVLASLHGAKTLLGSATPSVETYYKATEGGKYGLVTLSKRFGNARLPEIQIMDLRKERLKGNVDTVIAKPLIAQIRAHIADGKQAILFHNRRGFSPRARCRMCQFTPKCDFCDVSLTYHKRTNTLECHYCGAVYPVPKICPACHEPTIEIEGYGTERIEDSVAEIFPEAKVLRMDLDTTRNKDSYASIIDDFSQHKADILVGTQMVTKGLDFANVGIVGVINADNILNFPDFRSSERAFNMLEQVAGRAGRGDGTPGTVVIQTYTPKHPVIGFVEAHDYIGFFNWEIEQRRKMLYPPAARIVNIFLRHRDRGTVERFARDYAAKLRTLLGSRVNGPVEPAVERVASMYIRQIMLRIETGASIAKVKQVLRDVYLDFNSAPVKSGVTVHYDVDPV